MCDTKQEKKSSLKPLNRCIQICPVCNKVDAYKGDNHDCMLEAQNQFNQDYYD
jgi:hypothetical protein